MEHPVDILLDGDVGGHVMRLEPEVITSHRGRQVLRLARQERVEAGDLAIPRREGVRTGASRRSRRPR